MPSVVPSFAPWGIEPIGGAETAAAEHALNDERGRIARKIIAQILGHQRP